MAAKKSTGITSAIEFEIRQLDELTSDFQTLPNVLLRGEANEVLHVDFTGLTLRARALLGALAGMKDGYRCNRARIERLAPELGREALDTVTRELRTRGFLQQVRINDGGGKFTWRWSVTLRPVSAAQTMHGLAVDGSPVDGSAVDGSPAVKRRSTTKTRSTRGGAEELTPPPPPALTPLPPLPDPEEEGSAAPEKTKGQSDPWSPELVGGVLDDVLAATGTPASRHPINGKRVALAGQLQLKLDAGWTPAQLVAALGSEPLASAKSVPAVLGSRIRDLGAPPPAAPAPRRAPELTAEQLAQAAAECGRCEPFGVAESRSWFLPSGAVCRHEPAHPELMLVTADAG